MLDLKPLDQWFIQERRNLPWREDSTPYKVWISEVMLQQTQVKTVIPYFEKWIRHYPTLKDLAAAPVEDVIKLWEGLGYYSRARNLHESAKRLTELGYEEITEECFPYMKGLGPYTKGAILSFAFKKRAAAVDGNVQRVISRLIGFQEEISKASSKKIIETWVLNSLSVDKPWHTMEALIELGALICQKKANCPRCPMSYTCQALKDGTQNKLPVKKERAPTTKLERVVLLVQTENDFLLKKGEKGKIMQDLYEFPWVEKRGSQFEWGPLKIDLNQYPLKNEIKHSFTRYEATLFAYEIRVRKTFSIEGYSWIEKSKIRELPFSSGHRKLLEKVVA